MDKSEDDIKSKILEKKEKINEWVNSQEFAPLKEKEIATLFSVPNDEKNILKEVLAELVNDGVVIRTGKGKFVRTQDSGFVKGKYLANEKGFGFVSVEDSEEDIFVSRENSLTAVNNDDVLVEVIKEKVEGRKAEGKIVKVLKRNTLELIGEFQKSQNYGFVVADDPKISYDFFISKNNMGKAQNHDKVCIQILKWPVGDKSAEAKIIDVLGKDGDPKLDYLSVVKMYNLDLEFDEKVLSEAKRMPKELSKGDYANRRDLRDECIFTIDSYDTKDIDDAISVKKLDDETYELGVHIADVSNYVRENSALDNEANYRGTSVYLINKVIPMLPKELSNGICSLNENVDRCALSIVMKIDKKGEVRLYDIFKSIISSKKKGVYSEINDILDNKTDAKYSEYEGLIDNIKLMNELKEILEKKREKRGSIEFDLYESKVILDENDKAIFVDKRERGTSEQIIEEFMLAANETIAHAFNLLEAPFVYRIHEAPDIDRVYTLSKILNNLGIRVKGLNAKGSATIHPKVMQEILAQVKNADNGKMISNLVLRSMQLARYCETNMGHFGLAAEYYCHFTSPIRRYPDLFIHRVISRYLETNYCLSGDEYSNFADKAIECAKDSSESERNAEKAEREFDEIKMCEYMEGRIGEEYEGVISALTSFGMFVELDNTVEGLVRYDSMYDDYYDFDEENMCIIGRKNKRKYIVGQKVNIKVVDVSKKLRRIDFELLFN